MGPLDRRRGFTLIEIVVVLLIFGVVVAMAAAITRGITASQKRTLTTTRMATLEAALVQFVQQTKRLPCPADGTLASSVNGAGLEASGLCANQQNGIVPYRSLGLTESDATDGWFRRFTYRVDPELAKPGGMDMSGCDPAGLALAGAAPNYCVPACSGATCTSPANFLSGRGLTVRTLATLPPNPPAMDPTATPRTGAAYVLISHGESGGGAYLSSGNLAVSVVADGDEEKNNYADKVLGAYYVDNDLVDTPGTGHFDDIVSRPSILAVATRAALGPRSH